MGLTINRLQYYTVRLENTLNKFCVIKSVLWFEQHTEHNIQYVYQENHNGSNI